jgi:hypothetical protein
VSTGEANVLTPACQAHTGGVLKKWGYSYLIKIVIFLKTVFILLTGLI